jgi:hypothetical protein
VSVGPPCLTRYGTRQPDWVCDWINGGAHPSLAEIRAGNEAVGAIVVAVVGLLLILLAVLDGARGRRSWREFWRDMR